MRVLDIEQNTEEWDEFRKGKSGGSAFGKLFKVNGRTNDATKDYFYRMLAERVARPMTPNDYQDRVEDGVKVDWRVRGHILENDAAKLFSAKYHKKLEDGKVWISDYNSNSYVSPDRVIRDEDGKIKEAVEIKCLSSDKVLKLWWERKNADGNTSDFDILPPEYQSQVLKYFMVNDDLWKLYWVLYTDLIPQLEMQVFEIEYTDICNIMEEARKTENRYLAELDKAEKELEKM